MAFPTYSLADLAQVAGREPSFYNSNAAYVSEAIFEATLLFQVATNREDAPTAGLQQQLMRLGILKMADAIWLTQPNAELLASPFQSESIGSYSYSRLAGMVAGGLPTGITWFDTAVSRLKLGLPTDIITGGFEVFENEEQFLAGHIGQNQRLVMRHEDDKSLFYEFGGDPIMTHDVYETQTLYAGDVLAASEPLHIPAAKAQSDLKIAQGADNVFTFRYLAGDPAVPVDLSTYTAHAQLRSSYEGELWLDLTSSAGITLDNQGYITVTVAHAVTQDPSWNGRTQGVWDLELTDHAGHVSRFIEGSVLVSPDVTH